MAKEKFTKSPEVIEVIKWTGTGTLPAELASSPYVQKEGTGANARLIVTSEVCQQVAKPGDYLLPSVFGFRVLDATEFEATHTKKA